MHRVDVALHVVHVVTLVVTQFAQVELVFAVGHLVVQLQVVLVRTPVAAVGAGLPRNKYYRRRNAKLELIRMFKQPSAIR